VLSRAIVDAASLGALIRERRLFLKMSQHDLALAAHVGPGFIADLEGGKETCQIGPALSVVRELGIRLIATPIPNPPPAGTMDEPLGIE